MKIEEAIKQSKPFASPVQKTMVNLLYTHGWLRGRMDLFFKKYALTSKQFNILRILKGSNKPVSTAFIKERLLDKNSDVSRIVDRLFDKKLVVKSTCQKDKRLVDVALSSAGESLLDKVNHNIYTTYEFFKNLSTEELNDLNSLLDKLRGN